MRIKSFSPKNRWLVTIILLFSFCVANTRGATYTGTFRKITSTDSLQTGYYVITSSESAGSRKALGTTINSDKRATGQNVTISNDTIRNPDNTIVFLITKSSANYTFYNVNSSKYLYQASTTSGKGMGYNNSSYNFTLSGINSDSPKGFKFQMNGASNYMLKWNNGSSWFANYADNGYSTTMAPVTLYRKAFRVIYNGNGNTGGTVPRDVNLYFDGLSVTLKSEGSLVKSGYTFMGWIAKDASNNTVTITNGKITMPTSDVTVTAQWEATASCTTNASISPGTLKGSILQTNLRQSFYHLCNSLFSYLHYVKDRNFQSFSVRLRALYFIFFLVALPLCRFFSWHSGTFTHNPLIFQPITKCHHLFPLGTLALLFFM